jgi:hypothetical protein
MQSKCNRPTPIYNLSPQIAAAYQRLVFARTQLLDACGQDQQEEVANLDEDAWYAYEDEVVGRIQSLTTSLDILLSTKSETLCDLALKVAVASKNKYVTPESKREIERESEQILQMPVDSVGLNTVKLERPKFMAECHAM